MCQDVGATLMHVLREVSSHQVDLVGDLPAEPVLGQAQLRAPACCANKSLAGKGLSALSLTHLLSGHNSYPARLWEGLDHVPEVQLPGVAPGLSWELSKWWKLHGDGSGEPTPATGMEPVRLGIRLCGA